LQEVEMMKKLLVYAIPVAALILLIVIGVIVTSPASEPSQPSDIGIPAEPIANDDRYSALTGDMKYYRNPDYPVGYSNPVECMEVPQHPFMAPNDRNNNMHCDAYMTDTNEVSGPLGISPRVISSYLGFKMCATNVFDAQGRIMSMCANVSGPELRLHDAETLNTLATYRLPDRPQGWEEDPIGPLQDTSGGAYFYIDPQYRAVMGTFNLTVQVIEYDEGLGDFRLVREYDLSDYLVPREPPERDKLQPILPDWNGLWWFVSRYGMVGTLDQDSGEVHTLELKGEELQNSYTIGEDGVYIISDYAMYRFNADEEGRPVIDWRVEYDRGTRCKPGMINHGSGTTPTLIGDVVAIADNAEPRMNVMFLNRSSGETLCSIPVFEDGQSATDNCLVGLAREGENGTEYSVVVENNYGYLGFPIVDKGRSTVGGLMRIDAVPDGSGGYACKQVWTSDEISPTTVPKMSLGNGLVYFYTKYPREDMIDAWYFTAVDFETGDTVWRVLTGTGLGYNNHYSPIFIGPQGGTAYIGTLNGLISIRDTAP
jgi:hypothetical protein